MSIISSDADNIYESSAMPGHPDLMRLLYDSDDLREAYERGAERQPTEEEIKAACLAIMPYVISQPSQQVFDFLTKATGAYPGQEIVQKVIDAMRGKATEE